MRNNVAGLCRNMTVLALGCATLATSPGLAAQAQTTRKCVALKKKPYSSTYLPANQGFLTRVVGTESDQVAVLAPELVNDAHSTTVAERFDRLQRETLRKPSMMPFFHSLYRKGAADWEGVCHQWAPASVDAQINDLVMETQGLVCGRTYLTRGSLKELFTALYYREEKENEDNDEVFVGTRAKKRTAEKFAQRIKEAGAVDDVPAHEMHNVLFTYLSNNRGVIMDEDARSKNGQVWNQPIYGICSDYTPVYFSTEELKKKVKADKAGGFLGIGSRKEIPFAGQIPLSAFVATTPEAKTFLDKMHEFRKLAQTRATWSEDFARANRQNDKDVIGWWKYVFDIKDGGKDMDGDYARLWRALIEKRLMPAIENGSVVMRKSGFYQVSSTVSYGKETDAYADNAGEQYEDARYQYFLVVENNAAVDSAWITPFENRPDFLWAHKAVDLSGATKAENPQMQAIVDLLQMMKGAHGCVDVKDVNRFVMRLRSLAGGAGAALDDASRASLVSEYAKVRGAVNRGLMQQLVASAGLSQSDFQ
jgi:hypothetical protein